VSGVRGPAALHDSRKPAATHSNRVFFTKNISDLLFSVLVMVLAALP
jgi:hypothetical protein